MKLRFRTMAEFSKEWCEKTGMGDFYDFSIKREFSKLKEGQSISIICEGFGFNQILNKGNNCFVSKRNQLISLEDLLLELIE